MHRCLTTFFLIIAFAVSPLFSASAYEEVKFEKVMSELENTNAALFKKATKVYKYATINSNEIIDKPLLVKHNQALNGFVDRDNKVSAKFYASGTKGTGARMVMLFKFGGKKYKVIEDYTRAEKCKKWSACAPWQKAD